MRTRPDRFSRGRSRGSPPRPRRALQRRRGRPAERTRSGAPSESRTAPETYKTSRRSSTFSYEACGHQRGREREHELQRRLTPARDGRTVGGLNVITHARVAGGLCVLVVVIGVVSLVAGT